MKKQIIILITLILFSLTYISASVICSPTSISVDYNVGETPASQLITCTNSDLNDSVIIDKLGSYFSTNPSSPITINAEENKQITINFESAPVGSYQGLIWFNDGSTSIPVNIDVTDSSSCQLNPSLVSYSQTFQQGTETELPKIIFNPKNCDGDFSITSAYISGGITTSSGQKPIYIKTASSTDILLGVDTSGLSSLTYPTKLTVVAFGKTFSDISTITIIVTGSTTPQGNFSADNIPTCSITNTILNINQTYSMICSNLQPDISINPIIDDEYIKGIGVDTSSNQYIWYFQPKKMGNTIIKAVFNYLNSPVGDTFSQEVKIQSSGSIIPGTNLKLLFTPSLDKISNGEQTIIQLIDNKTESLVENPEIYVNAIKLNSINNSDKSFPFTMEADKDYEIRGKSPGYEDLLETINITNKPIEITLTPLKSFYTSGEKINITTNVNASILINNIIFTGNPYTFESSGNVTIKAVKQGYESTEKIVNVQIATILIPSSCTIEPEKWKKGKKVLCGLTEESDWKVYLNNTLISEGNGKEVSFELEDYGMLEIKSGEVGLWSQNIEKGGMFNWAKEHWVWSIIICLIIFGGGYLYWINREGDSEYGSPIDRSAE